MLHEPFGSALPDRDNRFPLGLGTETTPPRSPFVGRDGELAELRAGLDSVSNGEGRVFLIGGEPGIGKTRLSAELASEACARGAKVCWGRCWESGGAPTYWPWVEVLRQILRTSDKADLDGIGRHAGYLVQLIPEFAESLGTTSDAGPSPADPESARFFLFDAIGTLLGAAARRQPLVVIIDDLHAADRASLLLLAFLSRSLAHSAFLLVGTYRQVELRAADELLEPFAETARHARRLGLRGLGADDIAHLIEIASGERPSLALTSDVHRVTDGNPFYVDELLRLLAAEGRLCSTEPVSVSLAIPDGVQDAVRRRLEPLSSEAASLLEIAAVAGREFDTAVLRLAARLDPIAVVAILDEPLRHGIIVPTEGPPGRFAFRHALIREAIYEGLPLARRLPLHRRLAEGLQELALGDPELYVAELAHHFLEAAPCDRSDDFVEHGIRAARSAMRRMAFEEAVRLYERTIDATAFCSPDERRRCELLLALGQAQEWAGDPTGSRATAERAAEIARHLGATDLLARAALGVGSVEALKLTARSRCDGAPSLLREALDRIEPDKLAIRARLQSRLAVHTMSSGTRTAALDLSAQAIADARSSDDRDTLAHALLARHAVLLGPDHIEERCAIASEFLELAIALGSREYTMRSHALRAANFFDLGDIAAADQAIAEHARLAEESGDPFERWVNLMWRSTRALLVGDFSEAERSSRAAFELSRTVPGPHAFEVNGPMSHVGQMILIREARHDGVPDPEVIERYRNQYPEVALWHVALLHRSTRLGHADDVRRELEFLTARSFVDFDRNATWLAAMSFLSEAVALVRDLERAAVLYDVLLPYATRNATVLMITSRGSISHSLGLLAATLGRHTEATQHFDTALAMNRRMGARPMVAVTLHDYAAALLRAANPGAATRAHELAREAHAIAADLGMPELVARCEMILEGLELPTPKNSAGNGIFTLARDGPFWTLARDGRHVLLKHAKGLSYLAELLRRPDLEIHVLDLVAAYAGEGGSKVGGRTVASTGFARERFSEEVLDAKARRDYERRLASLDEQLAAAEASGEPEERATVLEEITALRQELARTTGLQGRTRRSSDAERARISVTRTIRLSLAHIAEASPELGGQLARSIRTGTYCRYVTGSGSLRGNVLPTAAR